MVDPLIPNDVIVTIGGSVLTTQIYNFDETGGDTNTVYTKTFNRYHKVTRGIPSDWTVTFQATAFDKSMSNVFNQDSNPQTISLAWTGSMTITYSNARNFKLNYTLNAEDRLLANVSFVAPYYNTVGSTNRVIS